MLYFRFGLPFVLYMERTVTWDALQKEILEKMRHLLRPGVYIQVGKGASRRRTNQESPPLFFCQLIVSQLNSSPSGVNDVVSVQVGPFSLRVVGVVGITYLLPQDERPLCHPTVDRSVLLIIRYPTDCFTLVLSCHLGVFLHTVHYVRIISHLLYCSFVCPS